MAQEFTLPETAVLVGVDVRAVRRWVQLAIAGGESPLDRDAIRVNELTRRVYIRREEVMRLRERAGLGGHKP
jgi:hypothetical protein